MDDRNPNALVIGRRSVSTLSFLLLAAIAIVNISAAKLTGFRIADINPLSSDTRAVNSLQDSFSSIDEKAEPGVVSITSVQLAKGEKSSLSESLDNGGLRDFLNKYNGENTADIPNNDQPDLVTAAGSGAIVRRQGSNYYVLTNYHVVADAYRVIVTLDNDSVVRGTVIGLDPVTDIAVIRISSPQLSDRNIIPMGDSSTVKVGSWALAMGSPYGFDHSFTVGVISALNRELQEDTTVYPDLIQTDASINKGNSGGPLLDIQGRIIGINTAIASPSGGSIGLGFAIPINTAKGVLDDLIANGRVIRGWLGIGIQDLTPALKTYYGVTSGVLVASVTQRGPADKAGLKPEDIIISMGAGPVNEVEQVQKLAVDTNPGTSLPLTVIRGGRTQVIKVTLGLSPQTPKGRPSPTAILGRESITVQTLSDDLASRLGADGVNGVVVTALTPGSTAEEAGLEPGDIITKFNGTTIESEERFASMIKSIKPDGIVALKVIRDGTPRMIGFKTESD